MEQAADAKREATRERVRRHRAWKRLFTTKPPRTYWHRGLRWAQGLPPHLQKPIGYYRFNFTDFSWCATVTGQERES